MIVLLLRVLYTTMYFQSKEHTKIGKFLLKQVIFQNFPRLWRQKSILGAFGTKNGSHYVKKGLPVGGHSKASYCSGMVGRLPSHHKLLTVVYLTIKARMIVQNKIGRLRRHRIKVGGFCEGKWSLLIESRLLRKMHGQIFLQQVTFMHCIFTFFDFTPYCSIWWQSLHFFMQQYRIYFCESL